MSGAHVLEPANAKLPHYESSALPASAGSAYSGNVTNKATFYGSVLSNAGVMVYIIPVHARTSVCACDEAKTE